MEVFGGLYPLNGEQPYCDPQRSPVCIETRHMMYNSLRSVHQFLCSSPFNQPPKSYALQWARHSSKSPLPMRTSAPHLIHGSLGSPNSASQTESWLVQPFCTDHGRASLYFTICRPFPHKIARFYWGISITIYYVVPWAHLSPNLKHHLDRFSHFCRAYNCNRPTDHATWSAAIGHIYVCCTMMRPNN